MATDVTTTAIDPTVLEDYKAVIQHIMNKTPIEPEIYQRIKERGARITERLRQENVQINTERLLREVRDEE